MNTDLVIPMLVSSVAISLMFSLQKKESVKEFLPRMIFVLTMNAVVVGIILLVARVVQR